MAVVVLAEDSLLDRPVALKRLTTAADPRGLSRLRREALMGASVSHQNLVSIYDVVTTDEGEVVIVMEYVRGETLGDVIKREGKLPPPEALRILKGVAAGLEAIHAQQIVHRDVKPANILLGEDGAVKLADLGIASDPERTRITSAGAVLGTFSYMAPEQLEDAESTPAIDVYALAAVAFEMLAGRKARPEPNPMALAHAIHTQPPPDLRAANPDMPPEAAEVLMRGMSRDPHERPRSASDLVRRLAAALVPEETAPVQPKERPKRQRPKAPVIAAAAAAPAAAAPAAAAPAAAAAASPAPAAAASDAASPAAAPPAAAAPDAASPAAAAPDAASPATAAPDAASPAAAAPAAPSPAAAAPAAARSRATSARPRDAGPRKPPKPLIQTTTPGPSRRWLIPAGLLVLAAAVAALIIATSGSSPKTNTTAQHAKRSHKAAGSKTTGTTTTQGASSSTGSGATASGATSTSTPSSSAAASSSASGAATGAAAGDPVSAVKSFYTLAASHQYSKAWALADPAFQAQLAGYDSFRSGQADDRSITFDSASVSSQSGNSATVAIRTTSNRTNGTQHCSGTVDLVQSSGSWLLHQIHINCV